MISHIDLKIFLDQFKADVDLTRKVQAVREDLMIVRGVMDLDNRGKFEKHILAVYKDGAEEVFYPTNYGVVGVAK